MNGQGKILCPLMKKINNKQGSNLYNLVLEVLSRVPDPQKSAEKKRKKNVDQAQHTQIWEVHFGPGESSRETLEKISKVS